MEQEKYHPQWGIPGTKRKIWYIFCCKWKLIIKSMIIRLQSVDPERLCIEQGHTDRYHKEDIE